MPKKEENTELAVLESARKLFKLKGLDGTSVQEIASDAGTTKSMVNYYFRSKEKLFTAVFQREFMQFFSGIAASILSGSTLKEKIEKIVELDTQKLLDFPDLPIFIINEINRNGDIVFAHLGELNPAKLFSIIDKQIEEEVNNGNIHPIRAYDLFMSIQGLTIFPFLGKPLLKKVNEWTDDEFKNIVLNRKKIIVDMIWNYIAK
ncbi:TetR/AcrR family transcriptional regulator [Pollutibacter soli]|uniref:TetR/AcrR family transcriptional regulator n=1 Tax=Pollutibacter soli TaxID=3034157 RepID=UPI0030134F22